MLRYNCKWKSSAWSILQLFIVDSNDWPLHVGYYYLNCEYHAFLLRAFVVNESSYSHEIKYAVLKIAFSIIFVRKNFSDQKKN